MTVDQMRIRLFSAYSGDKWKKKIEKMPDNQVIAIYKRLESQGKLK